MTKVRVVLVVSLAACMALAAGCKTLAGSACLKPPLDADVQDQPLLRIPVGLDPVDSSATLKVPPLDANAAPAGPVSSRCLEDPPLIQPLPDVVAGEKAEKRAARKAARKANEVKRAPGPRLGGQ
jgi:hypothetical protein